MDELLTVSSTRRFKKDELESASGNQPTTGSNTSAVDLSSVEAVLEALRSQPSLKTLAKCLRWLVQASTNTCDFNIKVPGPKAAQVVYLLANDVLANFWPVLTDDPVIDGSSPRKDLVSCLSSLAGISALASRLKALTQALNHGVKTDFAAEKRSAESLQVSETIDFLQILLGKDLFLYRTWQDIDNFITKPIQRDLAWKELMRWLSTGKLVTIASAASAANSSSTVEETDELWIANGSQYSKWLGRNVIASAAKMEGKDPNQTKKLAQLLGKSLSLGYSDELIDTIFSACIAGDAEQVSRVQELVDVLPSLCRRSIVFSVLRVIAKRFATLPTDRIASLVPGVAFLVQILFLTVDEYIQALQDWILGTAGGGAGLGTGVHKAVIAAIASGRANGTNATQASPTKHVLLEKTLNRLLTQFGNEMYIKHSPVFDQEVCAQDLLLLYGQVHRLDKDKAIEIARSSVYINAISHRLAAASRQAQSLGMIVGTAVSSLIDAPDKRMKFDLEDMGSLDKQSYLDLLKDALSVGCLDDLKWFPGAISTTKKSRTRVLPSRKKQSSEKPTGLKTPIVQEVDDDLDAEDDLPTYAKPDSDKEDEDEDPTVIQRNKPTAPVYIRDLLAGLRDTENYDRHRLALSTAADLIRRKTNFGAEVTSHIEELATQLVGLKDAFDLEKFQEMRLRGMIAVVVAKPVQMGQWFANILFNGDYSMSQRASILTALSIAARELAGYREEDSKLTGAAVSNEDLFPSKRLPDKYAKLYAADASPVDELSKRLEQSIIKPMALEAADKVSGPDVLKVRTFSSRMEVEKKRKRPIKNELAKVVADGFFFPLTGRFRSHTQAQGEHTAFSTSFLQAHFLKTLALILNASGPSTLSLLALTTEFWSLLLYMRQAALNAPPVLEALLFSFLTLLEINNNDPRRIAEDHGSELIETQAWVEQVFQNLGGGSDEGEKARVLAASILVRSKEIIDKYQRMLAGHGLDFT